MSTINHLLWNLNVPAGTPPRRQRHMSPPFSCTHLGHLALGCCLLSAVCWLLSARPTSTAKTLNTLHSTTAKHQNQQKPFKFDLTLCNCNWIPLLPATTFVLINRPALHLVAIQLSRYPRRGRQGDVHSESRPSAGGRRQWEDGDGLIEGRFLFWRD